MSDRPRTEKCETLKIFAFLLEPVLNPCSNEICFTIARPPARLVDR